ncbi:hypothetical protein R5R35_010356 [Gryllus longicercus]
MSKEEIKQLREECQLKCDCTMERLAECSKNFTSIKNIPKDAKCLEICVYQKFGYIDDSGKMPPQMPENFDAKCQEQYVIFYEECCPEVEKADGDDKGPVLTMCLNGPVQHKARAVMCN